MWYYCLLFSLLSFPPQNLSVLILLLELIQSQHRSDPSYLSLSLSALQHHCMFTITWYISLWVCVYYTSSHLNNFYIIFLYFFFSWINIFLVPSTASDEPEQPTNLLATFIEYTSIVTHDVRGKLQYVHDVRGKL